MQIKAYMQKNIRTLKTLLKGAAIKASQKRSSIIDALFIEFDFYWIL